jgi:hypothetical protein
MPSIRLSPTPSLGKLSEKEACIVLGVTRRTFEELLPQFGFSVLADDQDTIDVELHP